MLLTSPKRKLTLWLALFALIFLNVPANAAEEQAEQNEAESPASAVVYKNYSGLADLVTMICNDALERFQGFYGPSVVAVKPFATLGQFQSNKQSELGITLADQMTAVINNETLQNPGDGGSKAQELHGLLQEVDGYLRVHISGINASGKRTSYVVSVEMSDPIYRALHTYL